MEDFNDDDDMTRGRPFQDDDEEEEELSVCIHSMKTRNKMDTPQVKQKHRPLMNQQKAKVILIEIFCRLYFMKSLFDLGVIILL
jgi:hypothetical protein